MPKRKASFAFPYERPSKITKRTSNTTVSRTLSSISKTPSVVKPPLKMPKFPSLRASKPGEVIQVSAAAPLPTAGGSPTPPALRRASTLTLDDYDKVDSAKASFTKRKSSTCKPSSLSKKSSSFVEEGALVTKLSGLKSGSIVGETSLASTPSLTKSPSKSKSLSRKSSSITGSSSGVPSLPSGLTKLALPKETTKSGSLRISKSTLVDDIDEIEMISALDSLKSTLSKEGSKKRSMSKSASVRSSRPSSPVKKASVNNDEEPMDLSTASSSSDQGPAAGPPSDGLMEVAISFDTTGSMYGCLEEVKAKVQDLVQRLQTDIPGIRVAIIAHGDYCDESNYIIKWIDFGASLPEICDFVKNVGPTLGGDGPECYELVLQRSREVLSWTEGSKRILVMISDDIPHEPGYTYGGKTYFINWRDECAALKEMGVKIYGVQAGGSPAATSFNEEMAKLTGGNRLSLKNFGCIFDVLMMICYREGNPAMLAVYEQEIIDRGDIATSVTGPMAPSFIAPTPGLPPWFGKVTKGKLPKGSKVIAEKKTKKQTKKSSKSVTIQKREKLPDTCMTKGALKTITWSKWINGVEPKMPTNKQKSNFMKLRTNQGYGPKTIFDNDFEKPAIYEVAVQLPWSRKKYVVYFHMTRRGFAMSGHWSTNLLRHNKVRQEINNVLNQGCSIYIRRGLPTAKKVDKFVSQMKAANDYIRDNFDYAWQKYIRRRSEGGLSMFGLKHRHVKFTRKGKVFILSDSSI
ncbi:uncharacterized protein LOC132748644 isoform X2 [Ruditapes philippinarum]|uniref:uncharacterized protein LOC132748644 isoform X2 n=1 Tax=Ruditapes philippinarum TaxID=129788 RepID=UPI00295C1589|nr:uncharacterized protein LOC132748644 isoform X2 [Ruditapes philippinarum]